MESIVAHGLFEARSLQVSVGNTPTNGSMCIAPLLPLASTHTGPSTSPKETRMNTNIFTVYLRYASPPPPLQQPYSIIVNSSVLSFAN
jgi:hypothetical protein